MIDPILLSILFVCLLALNGVISLKLALMYSKDYDKRKLMFIIGLILTSQTYIVVMQGTNNSDLLRRVFEWCPIPLVFAFLFSVFGDRFNLNLSKFYKIFLCVVAVTISLFFIPLPFPSMLVLGPTVIFSLILAFVQYLKHFDLSSVTLLLSLPAFGIYYMGIYRNLPELAIFSAFIGTTFILLAFEVAKKQKGVTSSPLILQQKLETAETNFSVLFNLLPDPAVIIDYYGNFLEITDGLMRATGFNRQEFLGTNFFNLSILSKKDKAIMVKNVAKRLMNLTVKPYEIEVLRKDGKKVFFELNASKIDYDGKVAYLVLLRDLTERYNLINSLTEKEERFQDITSSTGDWIWEVDKDGVFVFTNSCAEKIIGYAPDEIVGKSFVNFLVPAHHEPAMTFLQKQKNKKESFAYELRSFQKSGKVVVLDIKAVSILGDSGAVVGYRGVTRDITEKIEMQKKLLKSERLVAVGELATMIAHDLRNPLQSISTAMYCLEKVIPEENSEKTKKLVANVKNSLNYSDKIVRELLDYSAKIKLDLAKTTPSELIKKALSTIIVPSGIKLLNNSKNKPVVYVDFNRIRRVCVNIITNAFDAMPKGGTLTISSKTANENLEIRFSDTGDGMTKQQMKKLMIPFVTTKAKGMGLGLAISKRIIEAHRGKIVVDSIVDQGTTFTIVLPLQKHAKPVSRIQNKPQPMEQISTN